MTTAVSKSPTRAGAGRRTSKASSPGTATVASAARASGDRATRPAVGARPRGRRGRAPACLRPIRPVAAVGVTGRARPVRASPRTVTGVIVPDDLPLSRAGVDRAALPRTEDGLVRTALADAADPRAAGARRRPSSRGGRCAARAAATRQSVARLVPRRRRRRLAAARPRRRAARRYLGAPGRRTAGRRRRVGEASDVAACTPAPTAPAPAVAPTLPDGLRLDGAARRRRAAVAPATPAWRRRPSRSTRGTPGTRAARAAARATRVGAGRLDAACACVDGVGALPADRPGGDHGGRRRRRPASCSGTPRTGRRGRFSTLAGFVEPGESLEPAVRREVARGGRRRRRRRRPTAGSQPWPFPASLMLGFRAHARRRTDVTRRRRRGDRGALVHPRRAARGRARRARSCCRCGRRSRAR